MSRFLVVSVGLVRELPCSRICFASGKLTPYPGDCLSVSPIQFDIQQQPEKNCSEIIHVPTLLQKTELQQPTFSQNTKQLPAVDPAVKGVTNCCSIFYSAFD